MESSKAPRNVPEKSKTLLSRLKMFTGILCTVLRPQFQTQFQTSFPQRVSAGMATLRIWVIYLGGLAKNYGSRFWGRGCDQALFSKNGFPQKRGNAFSEWRVWKGFLQERQFSEEVRAMKIEKLLSSSPSRKSALKCPLVIFAEWCWRLFYVSGG